MPHVMEVLPKKRVTEFLVAVVAKAPYQDVELLWLSRYRAKPLRSRVTADLAIARVFADYDVAASASVALTKALKTKGLKILLTHVQARTTNLY